jgi:hypothetical protein
VPELRREPASEAADLLTELALKAEAILGYAGLRIKLRIETHLLAHALNELGIEPFRIEDVRRYKQEKARDVEQKVMREYRRQSLSEGFERVPIGTHVHAAWHEMPLKGYEGDVPPFALSRALDIKNRVPAAEFEVDELRVDKRYDPFLVVRHGKEQFYIDVWEEADFERDQAAR